MRELGLKKASEDLIFRQRLERGINEEYVGDLTSSEPKKVIKAAEKLMEVVWGAELKNELGLVRSIARQREFLGRIGEESAKIDAMPKDKTAKYIGYKKGYEEGAAKAVAEIERLSGKRTMSDEELKERLMKEEKLVRKA